LATSSASASDISDENSVVKTQRVRRIFANRKQTVNNAKFAKRAVHTVWTENSRQMGNADKGPPRLDEFTELNQPGQCSPGERDERKSGRIDDHSVLGERQIKRDIPALAGGSSALPAELRLVR